MNWKTEKEGVSSHRSNELRRTMTRTQSGKKTALFEPFIYKNQHFTKTGSGRT
jgi:hypothetical protein